MSALQSLCKTKKGRNKIKDCFINFEDIKDEECIKIQLHRLKVNNINDNGIKAEINKKIIIKLDLSYLNCLAKTDDGQEKAAKHLD